MKFVKVWLSISPTRRRKFWRRGGHVECRKAFEELLKYQCEPYKEHEGWKGYTPEVVRAAFLAIQKEQQVSIDDFRKKLEEFANNLGQAPAKEGSVRA